MEIVHHDWKTRTNNGWTQLQQEEEEEEERTQGSQQKLQNAGSTLKCGRCVSLRKHAKAIVMKGGKMAGNLKPSQTHYCTLQ